MIRKILVWYVKSRKKFDDFRVLSFIFWFGNKKHTKLLCCSFCVWESERKILIPYNTQQQRVLVRGLSNEKSKVIIVHSTVKQSRMSCVVLILKRERWKCMKGALETSIKFSFLQWVLCTTSQECFTACKFLWLSH